jgi:hypothetical protein
MSLELQASLFVVGLLAAGILTIVFLSAIERKRKRELERRGKPHGLGDKSKVGETRSFEVGPFTVKVKLTQPVEGELWGSLLSLKYYGEVTVGYPADWNDITAERYAGCSYWFTVTAHLKDGKHSQGQLHLARRDGDTEHNIRPAIDTFVTWERASQDSKAAAKA